MLRTRSPLGGNLIAALRAAIRRLITAPKGVAVSADRGTVGTGKTAGVMEYTHQFVEGPFDVIVTMSGAPTAEDMIARRTALLDDPRLRPGLNVLYDLSSLDTTGLSSADIRMLADDAWRFERIGLGSVAFVAPRPLLFGLLRMYQAHSDQIKWAERLTIVETLAEAYAWVAP